ncbi:MAG: HTTM domain-containing protein, partial [Myxococcota bacterium]|nr:HTTM domain-containing protein [Myxococcota bacterium]
MTALVQSGRAAWRAWVALWDHREDAAALALVRICVGLVLAYDLFTIARLGLVDALYLPPPVGYAVAYDGWASALGWSGATVWLVATIAAACIATGTLTRVACVVFVLASAQLGHIAPDGERGIDMMLRIVVGILACSRSHARWSIDAWVRRRIGKPLAHEVPAWPRYLLLLQLLWIYVSGGLNKGGASWGPFGGFTALANILADPHVARFDPAWVATALPLTRIATALTMAFELGAPLYLAFYYFAATRDQPGKLRALSNRLQLRWVWIALGLSFHLGIAITMRLGSFPWGMLALYPVLLMPRELGTVSTLST